MSIILDPENSMTTVPALEKYILDALEADVVKGVDVLKRILWHLIDHPWMDDDLAKEIIESIATDPNLPGFELVNVDDEIDSDDEDDTEDQDRRRGLYGPEYPGEKF